MVNPRKHQKLAISVASSILEIIVDKSLEIGNKIVRNEIFQYIDDSNMEIDKNRVVKALYDLKKSKYLIGKGNSVILTNKAKMKFVDKITATIPKSKKYHLVSFDVPESMRRNRDSFRRFIKRIGYVPLQKSLWVSKKEMGGLVELAAKEYGIYDYVAYFISEKSNIDRYIARQLTGNKTGD